MLTAAREDPKSGRAVIANGNRPYGCDGELALAACQADVTRCAWWRSGGRGVRPAGVLGSGPCSGSSMTAGEDTEQTTPLKAYTAYRELTCPEPTSGTASATAVTVAPSAGATGDRESTPNTAPGPASDCVAIGQPSHPVSIARAAGHRIRRGR